jgi:hypothetical protein
VNDRSALKTLNYIGETSELPTFSRSVKKGVIIRIVLADRGEARNVRIVTPTLDPYEDDDNSDSDEPLDRLRPVASTTDKSQSRSSRTESMDIEDNSKDNASGDRPEVIYGRISGRVRGRGCVR